MAMPVSMAPATPAQRDRRRRQRQNRRIRVREELTACRSGNMSLRGPQASTGYAPMMGDVVDSQVNEFVPSANFEPALPALVGRGGAARSVMASLGSTQAGQMWALKACHPNGEEVTASAGIPDHTNVPVVTPEFRCNYTIVGDSTLTGNDDVDIVMLPCSELAFMYRRYTAGTSPGAQFAWKFVFYPSLTAQGDAFSSVKEGTTEAVTVPYWTTTLTDFGRTRCMYNGMTVHLDAPTLADQGRLVAAQLPLEMRDGLISSGVNAYVDGGQPGATVTLGTAVSVVTLPKGFPFDESSLFQATPGAVVWEAREGVYLPLRFKEPVHLFEADRLETLFAVETQGAFCLQGVNANGNPSITKNLAVGVPNNVLSGIVCIRGIDKRANLNVKTRIGLESLVENASQVAPFQHQSPILDRVAIDQVARLSQASPMAYPAEYNDFGSIMGVIKNGISSFVKPISGALSGLGLPIVSDVAGGVNAIISGLGLAPRRRARRSALQSMGRQLRM